MATYRVSFAKTPSASEVVDLSVRSGQTSAARYSTTETTSPLKGPKHCARARLTANLRTVFEPCVHRPPLQSPESRAAENPHISICLPLLQVALFYASSRCLSIRLGATA